MRHIMNRMREEAWFESATKTRGCHTIFLHWKKYVIRHGNDQEFIKRLEFKLETTADESKRDQIDGFLSILLDFKHRLAHSWIFSDKHDTES